MQQETMKQSQDETVTYHYLTDEEPMKFNAHSVIDYDKNTIFTYIAFDPEAGDKFYIYDPRTNKHHEVSKEKYDEVMKNAK